MHRPIQTPAAACAVEVEEVVKLKRQLKRFQSEICEGGILLLIRLVVPHISRGWSHCNTQKNFRVMSPKISRTVSYSQQRIRTVIFSLSACRLYNFFFVSTFFSVVTIMFQLLERFIIPIKSIKQLEIMLAVVCFL